MIRTLIAALLVSAAACSHEDKKDKAPAGAAPGSASASGSGSPSVASGPSGTGSVPVAPAGSASASGSGTAAASASDSADTPVATAGVARAALIDRPDVGTPVSAQELHDFTAKYIAFLNSMRYFHFVDERIHGFPQDDPKGRYWYAQWWEYVWAQKTGDTMTYDHEAGGSDNTGVPTATILEGVCYARGLWADPRLDLMARKMIRAFSAWIMSSERMAGDTQGPVLNRAFYPEPMDSVDNGHKFHLDYSKVRPGVDDDDASEYVRVPQNPYWGDIWLRSKRSKDDVGAMLRAIGQLISCQDSLLPATRADLDDMRKRYGALAKKLVADNLTFASLNKQDEIYYPAATGHVYITLGGVECPGAYAWKTLAGQDPKATDCGTGETIFDAFIGKNHMNRRLTESHQEGAVSILRLFGAEESARPLLQGLGSRLTRTMDALAKGETDSGYQETDFVTAILAAANVGVPLTSREIRHIHGQVAKAMVQYHDPGIAPPGFYDPLNPSTPDGRWPFTPIGPAMGFREFALPLGTCTSLFRSGDRPLLDCAMLRAAAMP